MEKDKEKAVNAITEYLRTEASYADLMESAALAQSQIVNMMDTLAITLPTDQQPLTDEIPNFLNLAIHALMLLKPFETK